MSDPTRDAQPAIDQEIDSRQIRRLGAWLAVITVLGFVVGWGFYLLLARGEKKLDQPPPPIAEARAPAVVPGPGLQANPERTLAAYRAAEEKVLHGWAWVDRDAGIAQVPVEVAIERVAAAGALPDFTRPLEVSTP